MQTSEIIDGLKDLIRDREAFIEPGAPKDYIFTHDKAVLQAAVDELTRRVAKPLTLEQLKNMRSCPIWIENGCSNEYAIIYEITENCIRARSPNADYTLSFIGQGKTWNAYACKPEGDEP